MKTLLATLLLFLAGSAYSQNMVNVHITGGTVDSYDIAIIDSANFTLAPPPFYLNIYQAGLPVIQYLMTDIDSITYSIYGPLPANIFNPAITYDTLYDIDLNQYLTVQIGTQNWMAENLRTTKYSNGTPLYHIEDNVAWDSLESGAWRDYNHDPTLVNPYGKFYNWYAVADVRNVCPSGWHVPSKAEFAVLSDYLGVNTAAALKSPVTNWVDQVGLQANNSSGFSALGAGFSTYWSGPFYSLDYTSQHWTTTVIPTSQSAKVTYWELEDTAFEPSTSLAVELNGQSIRCLEGGVISPWEIDPIVFNPDSTYSSVTDIDGNIYKTIQIGSQEWMAQNLLVSRYSNGDTIPLIEDNLVWQTLNDEGYSTYNNWDSISFGVGNLYNYDVAKDLRNACPTGWRVPTRTDWNVLKAELGGANITGQKLKSEWWGTLPSTLTNISGFSGTPSYMHLPDGSFITDTYTWWSSADLDASLDPTLFFGSQTDSLGHLAKSNGSSSLGLPIRCINSTAASIFPEYSQFNGALTYGTVTDIDGNIYKTIPIGSQVWMAENLKTTRYANGTAIPNVQDAPTWSTTNAGAWSHYDNDTSYNKIFGKLYNRHAAVDPGNLCPNGWHVPDFNEFITLETFLGGYFATGAKIKTIGTEYWEKDYASMPPSAGNNSSGFSALPAGIRMNDGETKEFGFSGYWWNTTETFPGWADVCGAYPDPTNNWDYTEYSVNNGLSVRCIMD